MWILDFLSPSMLFQWFDFNLKFFYEIVKIITREDKYLMGMALPLVLSSDTFI